MVARPIEPCLKIAERRGLTLSLYPHLNHWLERVDDAARLCRKLDHPNLRTVFCGFHWYAVDGRDLRSRLTEASPYLGHANLSGCDPGLPGGPPRRIVPLDAGELDNFIVLAELARAGLGSGDAPAWLGVQGWSVAGDVYAKLRRSKTSLDDKIARLARKPGWAEHHRSR